MHLCSISLFVLAITVTAGNADILKREPPMGAFVSFAHGRGAPAFKKSKRERKID
jgi:hypothetical protein